MKPMTKKESNGNKNIPFTLKNLQLQTSVHRCWRGCAKENQISDVKIIQVHSNIQLEINYYLDLPSLPSLHPSHLGRLSRGAPWGP